MSLKVFATLAAASLSAVMFSAAVGLAAPVTLETGSKYQPFTDPDLPNGGMATEIVLQAFKAAGMETAPVEFVPWKRGYEETLAGRVDATFPYIKTDARLGEMTFSDSILEIRSVAAFPKTSTTEYKDPSSLKGLRLCLPQGYATPLQPRIDAGDIQVSIQPAKSSLCLNALSAGRADVFVENEYTLSEAAREVGDTSFRVAPVPVSTISNHLIVSKTHPEAKRIVEGFNAGLAKLKASGEWAKIVARHGGKAD